MKTETIILIILSFMISLHEALKIEGDMLIIWSVTLNFLTLLIIWGIVYILYKLFIWLFGIIKNN